VAGISDGFGPAEPGWSVNLEGDSDAARDAGRGIATAVSSAELFAAYQPRIRRYILSMVHNAAEAEDLTQEVFLQAHRKLGSLRDPDAAASWLYRIATHLCYDRFRKWAREPRLDPLDVADSHAADTVRDGGAEARMDLLLERAEMSACVRGFLDDISDEYRQVILLHDLEALTNLQIAEMLGVSVAAIKIRLHRARGKLQVALAASCDFSHDERGVLVCDPAMPHHG